MSKTNNVIGGGIMCGDPKTNPQSYIGSRAPMWNGVRYVPQPPLTLADVMRDSEVG